MKKEGERERESTREREDVHSTEVEGFSIFRAHLSASDVCFFKQLL
jgi:hypothetical protein